MKTADYSNRAIALSRKIGGKISLKPNFKIKSPKDFLIVYTPGVAAVSELIRKQPEASYALTWRWNTIFIITNGTRVLGLGDIGPLASLPVMEGKSLLYKTLGGVNAVPIPIESKDEGEFVNVVKAISVASGGIHLEDISSPFCFAVLERLQKELKVPVWHDDQQGTAAVSLAALINSFKLAGKDIKSARIILVGSGAANISLFNLLKDYGTDIGNVILIDSKGVLYAGRDDAELISKENIWKYNAMRLSNKYDIKTVEKAFQGADAVVAFSRPGPGVIGPEWIRSMAKRPIVFANSNPTPEIFPHQAKRAGAYIVGTGRSDFPNQINNSLVFPGLFRGTLDSRTAEINNLLAIAAAEELAAFARKRGISPNKILPKMLDKDLYPSVAAAVAEEAVSQGIASVKGSRNFFFKEAKKTIKLGGKSPAR